MTRWPRITVVTPSFNQGRYIAETIESVLNQQYPNVEHIVVDGGSTDGTLDVLRRFAHLTVVSEPDRGQADAINKGFALASGDVWAFLNSDDTLLPGALERVACEIDPARGRHIVMGRCRLIDERSRYIGIEHPSAFESFWRVLAIWKGYTLPQPAVFWTPEVWRTCGPMDLSLKYHLDYDLFCRFARRYRFHTVDQVLATYRLHAASKTEAWGETDRLEDSIALSRRYWGAPLKPLFWSLALSLAWYRFDRVGRARRLYVRGRELGRQRGRLWAVPFQAAAALLAPEVTFYLGVYPALRANARGALQRILTAQTSRRVVSPQTHAYLDRTSVWNDGWVGPRLTLARQVAPGVQRVMVRGQADLTYLPAALVITLSIDGVEVGRHAVDESGPFSLVFDLPQPLAPGEHQWDLGASPWFVPHRFARSSDYRPLAWRIVPPDVIIPLSAGAVPVPEHVGAGLPPREALWWREGWHDRETSGVDWLRWASGCGVLQIQTMRMGPAMLRGEAFSVAQPNEMAILLNGRTVATLAMDAEGFVPFAVPLALAAGDNTIEVESRCPPATVPGDGRPLGIAVRNLCLER